MLYSYITEACRDSAERHAMLDAVERLAQKLESDQTLMSLDRFPPPYVKKVLGSRRVVMEERFVGDAVVVVFLAAYYRGEGDYQKFANQDPTYLATLNSISPPEDALTKFLVARRTTEPGTAHPAPSANEHAYLIPTRSVTSDDGWMILESTAWVERMRRADANVWLMPLQEIVAQLGLWDGSGTDSVTWLDHPRRNGLSIAFRAFPSARRIALLAATLPGSGDTRQAAEARIADMGLDVLPTDADATILTQSCTRAYPDYIVLGDDVWPNVEQAQGKANLALSPEEANLLTSMLVDDDAGHYPLYPLFINGRPGTGKSTVLQYLFTELLYFHLTLSEAERTEFPPLYLTYSSDLLAQAKADVALMLKTDAKRVAQNAIDVTSDTYSRTFASAFGNFSEFCRSLLSADASLRFDSRRFVAFATFRKHWSGRASRSAHAEVRRLAPELAWHVVRTYIKGMRQDSREEIDSAWYAEIPSKQRSVTQATFDLVYENVWNDWYKPFCDAEGLWDAQDLARAVLDEEWERIARYPAIFCDEAQDFTKIELELILRLSLFGRRTVPAYLLRRIPFAFAGDPFQTLNPTGFNWEAVRATFHENVVAHLDRNGDGHLEFNYRELEYNYRSNRGIVHLSNLIQLARGVVFGIRGLRPQRAWFAGTAVVPATFLSTSAEFFSGLQAATDIVLLVPCDEGSEEEYVREDPVLSRLAYQDGRVTRTILSAARAKGLEFDRVVLYGFGEECAARYPRLLNVLEGKGSLVEHNESLVWQYFLNRLYVAASRAARQLIISDSERGLRGLWQIAQGDGPDRLRRSYGSPEWLSDDLTVLVQGDPRTWDVARQDPLDVARQLFERAKATDEPYLFNMAAANFRAGGDTASGEYSSALSLRAEGKLLQAGHALVKLRREEEALQCFWHACAWKELADLGDAVAGVRSALEFSYARLRLAPITAKSMVEFLTMLVSAVATDSVRDRIISDQHWSAELSKLVGEAELWTSEKQPEVGVASAGVARVEALVRAGIHIEDSLGLARLAAAAERHDDAIRIWRATGKSEPEWLFESRRLTEPYPGRLGWLARRGLHEDVVREYEAHRERGVSDEDLLTVVRSYLQLGRISAAAEIVTKRNLDDAMVEVLDVAMKRKQAKIATQIAEQILVTQVRGGHWPQATRLVREGELRSERGTIRGLKDICPTFDSLETRFVNAVGSEPSMVAAPDATRIDISRFLKELFVERPWARVPDVSLGEAALAFERTQRVMDALRFYERVQGDASNGEVVRFARIRWRRMKQRQMELAKPNERDGIQKKLAAHIKSWHLTAAPPEAVDMHASGSSFRLRSVGSGQQSEKPAAASGGTAPELVAPAAEGISTHREPLAKAGGAETPQAFTYLDVDLMVKSRTANYDMRLDGVKRRLEIRNRETRDVVTIYAAAKDVRTTEDGLAIQRGAPGTFVVPSWGMTIEFLDSPLPIVRCSTESGILVVGL
jgi:superfamily I DNA/RNA helicase